MRTLFIAWLTLAATPALAETLDLAACLHEAAANNPSLRAAAASVDKAVDAVAGSRAAFYPQVSATADATRRAGDAADLSQPVTGDTRDPATGQYSYGLTLKQSLFSGFRDEATVTQRKAELEGVSATRDKTAVQLVFDLESAFYQQLYTQKLIDLQHQVVDRRRENVRLVALRYEGGREDKGALLKSQASLKQAELDAAQAERQLGVTRAELARLLGRESGAGLVVGGEFSLPTVPPLGDPALTSHNTPAHREAEAAVRAAAAAVNAAYGERYPDIDATASAAKAGSWPPARDRFSVGLSLTLPLYTGGSQTANIRSAAAERVRAESAANATDLQTLADLQEAHAALTDSVARAGVQEEFFNAASLQAEIGRNQYSLGLVTFQDWDLLESGLIDAERSLLSTRRDALLAAATWTKTRGTPSEEAHK